MEDCVFLCFLISISFTFFINFRYRKGPLIWKGIWKIDMSGFLINYPDEPVGIVISLITCQLNWTTYCRFLLDVNLFNTLNTFMNISFRESTTVGFNRKSGKYKHRKKNIQTKKIIRIYFKGIHFPCMIT